MKKILLLLITAITFTACNNTPANFDDSEWGGTMSPNDERNDKINQFIDSYANNDLQSVKDMFSDDAVIQVNDDTMTVQEMIDGFSAGHDFYDGINNIDRRVNTMFYNNGSIYTNYWYTWVGTNKQSGEELSVKGHAYFQWKDGKIIETYNAFDPTEYAKVFDWVQE
ncbi:MAG: nuclear transport factor 2 family protein [Flavobacteriaceae bacterium]|nr:nuclear transport factor 2 family protein [Flavobacteriaceae bacterium]